MKNPGSVAVLHTHDGDIANQRTWLADGHVFADVTGSPAVAGLDDGWYRIVLTQGIVSRDGIPMFNLPILFGELRRLHWYPACPTRWTPLVNEAKAMLFFVEIPPAWRQDEPTREPLTNDRLPLAMNGDIWSGMFDAFGPDLRVWHAGHDGPFKITTPENKEQAYIYPVQIPEDLQTEAIALAEVCRWPDAMKD